MQLRCQRFLSAPLQPCMRRPRLKRRRTRPPSIWLLVWPLTVVSVVPSTPVWQRPSRVKSPTWPALAKRSWWLMWVTSWEACCTGISRNKASWSSSSWHWWCFTEQMWFLRGFRILSYWIKVCVDLSVSCAGDDSLNVPIKPFVPPSELMESTSSWTVRKSAVSPPASATLQSLPLSCSTRAMNLTRAPSSSTDSGTTLWASVSGSKQEDSVLFGVKSLISLLQVCHLVQDGPEALVFHRRRC